MREIAYHSQEIFGPLKDSINEEYASYKTKNDFVVRPPKK